MKRIARGPPRQVRPQARERRFDERGSRQPRPLPSLDDLHVGRQVLGISQVTLETEHACEVLALELVVARVVEVAEPAGLRRRWPE